MRIGVVGAGGVGGYYAAALARAGHDVVLVARGQHLEAILKNGLLVRSMGEALPPVAVYATEDPSGVPPTDAILVATKSWQLSDCVDQVRALMGRDTIVVPLQNGVEAHQDLTSVLPEANVGKGLTRIISKIAGPGTIEHFGAEPYIALAEADGEASARARALVTALRSAGVKAEIPEDIDAELWKKFLFVCALGGVSAVCRAPIGVVRSDPGSRSMLRAAMEEIRSVAGARGIDLPIDTVERTLGLADRLPPHGTASLQRDLEAGRPSELEAWSGAVVRLGKESQVSVPTHTFIYRALSIRDGAARGTLTIPKAPEPDVALSLHSDPRGYVVEPADGEDLVGKANAHAVMTRPGGVRGNHFHPRGYEVMTVVGPALVRTRIEGVLGEHVLAHGEARKFYFPPGVSHAVQNTGDDWGLLVAFNSVAHDPKNPDVVRDTLIEV